MKNPKLSKEGVRLADRQTDRLAIISSYHYGLVLIPLCDPSYHITFISCLVWSTYLIYLPFRSPPIRPLSRLVRFERQGTEAVIYNQEKIVGHLPWQGFHFVEDDVIANLWVSQNTCICLCGYKEGGGKRFSWWPMKRNRTKGLERLSVPEVAAPTRIASEKLQKISAISVSLITSPRLMP